MSVVVGLDPSLTATGFVGGDDHFTIHTKAGQVDRLLQIYNSVSIAAEGADLAVVEDLPTHAHGAGLTGMAQGVVRLALLHLRVPYITVTAATLKKYATGKGTAQKPDMRMEMFKRTGIDLRDDNQIDAWWLRQIGLRLLGDPDAIDLPQTHLAALAKVPPVPSKEIPA